MDRERTLWWSGGVVLVAAVLWPLVVGRDGFPLSNYPMFSGKKDRLGKIAHVVVRYDDGATQAVPPEALGTVEIMQASQIARAAVKSGERAGDLCERVAAYLVGIGRTDRITGVEVRTDEYDVVAYWSGDRQPRSTKIHAACPLVVDERAGQR